MDADKDQIELYTLITRNCALRAAWQQALLARQWLKPQDRVYGPEHALWATKEREWGMVEVAPAEERRYGPLTDEDIAAQRERTQRWVEG